MRNDPSELERVLQHAADLIVNAVAAQGPRALENPRSSTIYHEAGHAVLHAHFGEEVRRCKVWQQKRGAQRGQWVGETTVRAGWKSDETTSPLQDFRRACCQIAGLVAELLFDHDNFRRASSVDEIIVANGLAGIAALKMGRDQRSVMVQVVLATFDILKKNDGVVRKLAKDLKRRGVLRAACLTRLLASVCTGPSKYELN